MSQRDPLITDAGKICVPLSPVQVAVTITALTIALDDADPVLTSDIENTITAIKNSLLNAKEFIQSFKDMDKT